MKEKPIKKMIVSHLEDKDFPNEAYPQWNIWEENQIKEVFEK